MAACQNLWTPPVVAYPSLGGMLRFFFRVCYGGMLRFCLRVCYGGMLRAKYVPVRPCGLTGVWVRPGRGGPEAHVLEARPSAFTQCSPTTTPSLGCSPRGLASFAGGAGRLIASTSRLKPPHGRPRSGLPEPRGRWRRGASSPGPSVPQGLHLNTPGKRTYFFKFLRKLPVPPPY